MHSFKSPQNNYYAIKFYICILFFVFPQSAKCQIEVRTFNHELIPSNLKWQTVSGVSTPPFNSKAFKKWAGYWESDRVHAYTKLDLTGDAQPEYIITNNDFPSGGRPFLILEKKGSTWNSIAEYQGGTIFAKSDVKKGYAIHVYGKVGDFLFMELRYNGHKFIKVHEHTVPDIWVTEDFVARWQTINRYEQINQKLMGSR
jgi:hypothetical protein